MATSLKVRRFAVAARNKAVAGAEKVRQVVSKVYCTLCTRTVEATVSPTSNAIGRRYAVSPGQKCPHCASSLDAAYVFSNMS